MIGLLHCVCLPSILLPCDQPYSRTNRRIFVLPKRAGFRTVGLRRGDGSRRTLPIIDVRIGVPGPSPDRERATSENPHRRTAQNAPSATAWKITEGFSTVGLCRQEATDRDSFGPLVGLESSDLGPNPISQTVSPRTRMKKCDPASLLGYPIAREVVECCPKKS